MIRVRRWLATFARAMGISLCCLLLSLSPTAAADDASALRDQLERDQSAFDALVKEVNQAPLMDTADAVALARDLESAAAGFDTSTRTYRRLAENQDLASAADLAARGTSEIAAGCRAAAAALRVGDDSAFQAAQRQVNGGRQMLSQAVDRYDAYVDTHNRSLRTSAASQPGSSTSTSGGTGDWLSTQLTQTFQATGSSAPPVIALGIYLFAVGTVLNHVFAQRLARVIGGIETKRLRGGALAQVYGLHLVLLVALAYVALLLAGLLVIDLGLAAAAVFSQANRLPVGLVLALAVVVIGSLLGILRGLFGSVKVGTFGVEVRGQEEPGLWRLSEDTASAVGTRPADIIVLSPLPGIGVREDGGLPQLLLGRTRRVLTIGAPSILGLSVQQFQAILAHEYGHFSNRDTAWTSLTFRAGSSVGQTIRVMQSFRASGFWYAIVSFINPGLWLLLIYRFLFAYVTSGFSRMREVFADQEAIERYGAEPFKTGLKTVVANDQLFGTVVFPRLIELLRAGKYFSNVYSTADSLRQGLTPRRSIKRSARQPFSDRVRSTHTQP